MYKSYVYLIYIHFDSYVIKCVPSRLTGWSVLIAVEGVSIMKLATLSTGAAFEDVKQDYKATDVRMVYIYSRSRSTMKIETSAHETCNSKNAYIITFY